jgi:CubicO group peptidase (beta-lactamase class C family)
LALMEDDRLNLDDPVTRFLPDSNPACPMAARRRSMCGTC